jgi:hypothetical protein
VDPHADEHGRAADAEEQQVRLHRVAAEQRRDLRVGTSYTALVFLFFFLAAFETSVARAARGHVR